MACSPCSVEQVEGVFGVVHQVHALGVGRRTSPNRPRPGAGVERRVLAAVGVLSTRLPSLALAVSRSPFGARSSRGGVQVAALGQRFTAPSSAPDG